jgi:hypothetical protein
MDRRLKGPQGVENVGSRKKKIFPLQILELRTLGSPARMPCGYIKAGHYQVSQPLMMNTKRQSLQDKPNLDCKGV